MKLKQYNSIGRQLLLWLVYILYIIIIDGWNHRDRDTWHFILPGSDQLTDILLVMLAVYINLYFLIPVFYLRQKYVQYIVYLLLLVLAGGLSQRFLCWLIWFPIARMHHPGIELPTGFWLTIRIIKDTIDVLIVVSATMFIKLLRNAHQQEKKLREIEKEKFSAEMSLLKAQINPHFFFNTLNSLYALTLVASKESPNVVLKLSNLMRYMLYEASEGKVILRNELTHLQNYIQIEQMRFTDRLDLSFQYSGDIEGQWIAPLLLLPFIENAFKHGIENNSGWITIDLKIIENHLYLKVENSFDAASKPKIGGFGLANVKRRLHLIYPGSHELNEDQDEGVYKVDLKINL